MKLAVAFTVGLCLLTVASADPAPQLGLVTLATLNTVLVTAQSSLSAASLTLQTRAASLTPTTLATVANQVATTASSVNNALTAALSTGTTLPQTTIDKLANVVGSATNVTKGISSGLRTLRTSGLLSG